MNCCWICKGGCFFISERLKCSNMDELKQQIKETIISSLQLEDVKPSDIACDEPLFGEGLGLDSIDALELGVALKKKFGVKFSSESVDNKKHFASINALAEYIENSRRENEGGNESAADDEGGK